MNREIKFRAWDGSNMFTPNVIAFAECEWSCGNGRGMSIPFQPHITLMQFTGLKDKNGKEIYEGDILKPPYSERLFEVYYDTGTASFRTFVYSNGERNPESYRVTNKSFEVIGNIYENPELLKP